MTSDASAWMGIGWPVKDLPDNIINGPHGKSTLFDLSFPEGDHFEAEDKIFGYQFSKSDPWEYKETSRYEINEAWINIHIWIIKNVEKSFQFTDEFISWLENNKPKLYFGVAYS